MFSIAAWPAAPVAPATVITAVVAATGVASPVILTATEAEPPRVEVTRIVAGGAAMPGEAASSANVTVRAASAAAPAGSSPTPTTVSGSRSWSSVVCAVTTRSPRAWPPVAEL